MSACVSLIAKGYVGSFLWVELDFSDILKLGAGGIHFGTLLMGGNFLTTYISALVRDVLFLF